jgi:ribosomal protein S18 acetylase RimI-like enzyme
MIEIVYAREELIPSFAIALDSVARERKYLSLLSAELEGTQNFQRKLIAQNHPAYYAVEGGQVVGWVDISVPTDPTQAHRGHLGMGIVKEFRGQGLGSKLISAAIAHAQRIGLEKVELEVFADNLAAIGLYQRQGFEKTGEISRYRKIDGEYQDVILMERSFFKSQ